MELLIIIYSITGVILTLSELKKRRLSIYLSLGIIVIGILYVMFTFFAYGQSDGAWYLIFYVIAILLLLPVSAISFVMGRLIRKQLILGQK